jgi:Leucine-rich repeat (LRR) protein
MNYFCFISVSDKRKKQQKSRRESTSLRQASFTMDRSSQRDRRRRQFSPLIAQMLQLLTLMHLVLNVAGQQTICPVGSSYCSIYGYDALYIYQMVCKGFGTLSVLPPACVSNPLKTQLVRDLSIGANDTSVATLQSNILSGLRIANLDISGLQVQSVDSGAFDSLAADLNSLNLANNQLTILPTGVFGKLTALTVLRLDNNSLTSLPSGIFSTLSNLVTLKLDHNQLNSLPNELFSSLTKLSVLSLNNNQITSLSSGIFSTLTSLTVLTLDHNKLTSLPIGVFSALSHLSSLNLNDNQLSAVDTTATFSGLSSLTSLGLADNQLRSFVLNNTTVLLPQLTTLDLGNNSISGPIGLTMVNGLTRLQELRLNDNSLTELTVEAMSALVNIQRLNLSSNNITDLATNLFLNNIQLQVVDLSFNSINYLAPAVFNGTFAMTTLLLNDNQLTALPIYLVDHLPFYLFRDMNSLQVLHLQNNRIAGLLPNALSGLALVRDLDLSNNAITTLPLGVLDPLGMTESLSVANNQISRVDPKPFVSMKNLMTLSLANNRLTSVSADWFVLTSRLSTLLLGSNLISTIAPTTFENLTSLRELDLGENQLSNVDGLFSRCKSLQSLSLAYNPLRRLPDAIGTTFAGLTSLVHLNLSSTCMTNVSFRLSPAALSNLTELDLSSNGLVSLSANMFSGLPSLQKLNLAVNNIASIESGSFSQMPKLGVVNLSTNFLESNSQLGIALSQFVSLPVLDLSWNLVSALDGIPGAALNGIYLRGNPIACTCTVPSWAAADSQHLLDINITACMSKLQTPQLLICYWAQCNPNALTKPNLASCSVAPTGDTSYLLPGGVHQPSYCPWDPLPTTSAPLSLPQVAGLNVTTSPTAIIVSWNVTSDEFVPGVTVRVVVLKGSVQNVTDNAGNLVNGTLYVNQTEVVVENLASGENYTVCVQTVMSSTNGNYKCTTVELPALPAASSSSSVGTRVTDALTTPTAAVTESSTKPELVLSLSIYDASESSIVVGWSVNSGSADLVALFRLTWNVLGANDVNTIWITNNVTANGGRHQYTVANLTHSVTYLICVGAYAPSSSVHLIDNSTVCQQVSTQTPSTVSSSSIKIGTPTTADSQPTYTSTTDDVTSATVTPYLRSGSSGNTTLIIIIVVCLVVFLLLLLVLIIVICCYRRRRLQRNDEIVSQVKVEAQPPQTTQLAVSESTKSTRSFNSDRLAEHSVVSLNIYDPIPEV